ncbi:MAG: hypothetical protein ACK41T_12200 [Pseudobdellovibrio sp.]
MSLNSKNIFLIDGIGAALSAVGTALIFPIFSDRLGISSQALYLLAVMPFLYMLYSFSIYFFAQKIKPWMFIVIITANIFYCLVSGSLIFFYDSITKLGSVVLSLEIVIILLIVTLELKAFKKFNFLGM